MIRSPGSLSLHRAMTDDTLCYRYVSFLALFICCYFYSCDTQNDRNESRQPLHPLTLQPQRHMHEGI